MTLGAQLRHLAHLASEATRGGPPLTDAHLHEVWRAGATREQIAAAAGLPEGSVVIALHRHATRHGTDRPTDPLAAAEALAHRTPYTARAWLGPITRAKTRGADRLLDWLATTELGVTPHYIDHLLDVSDALEDPPTAAQLLGLADALAEGGKTGNPGIGHDR